MAIQKGTGFTNLSRIMQASRGNKLGQTVAGGIQSQAQGLQTQVKSAQEQFQEEAQKGRLDTGEAAQKRQEILGRFAPSTGAQQTQQPATPPAAAQAPTQPGQPAQPKPQGPVSEEEIKKFQQFRTGTYTGPKELQDQASLVGKAQQTEELGELARSEGGRQELLRRFVGGQGYTAGQKQLDTSILGQQPGQLGAAARQTRGAADVVERAGQQAANLAQEYTGRAKQFGEETVKQIGETRAPLSSELDKRVQEAQAAETSRLSQLKGIQDILAGTSPEMQGLDQYTRSGLALQEAADRGILSQGDVNMLLGKGDKIGLLQRGANLGLDMNKLINERITNQVAQNIARTGVASEEDIARLNALDRLAGKQGTDLEFLQGQGRFQAGKTGFNTGSLEEYISKTEAEKARSDKAYADKLAAEQARYLNQAMAGVGQWAGGAMTAAQGGLGLAMAPVTAVTDPGEMLRTPGAQITNAATVAQGVGDMGLGAAKTTEAAPNAVMEGLLKLNIGGKSLAQTPAGRQLLKAIELKSKLGGEALGAGTTAVGGVTGGLSALGRGDLGTALRELSGLETAKTLGGKAITNVSKSVGSAIKKVTGGKGIKISDEDLKEDIDYDPVDLQKFMDRIKPAAYNYKKEVQDSPLASKNRELGVMAQDLEKSKLGKEAVHDTEIGKVVDYDNLEPKMLASIAALNKRLNELEKKK